MRNNIGLYQKLKYDPFFSFLSLSFFFGINQATIQKLGLEALLWWSGECMGTKTSGLTTLLVEPCLAPLVRYVLD
jgi:hypothetical protein